MPVSKLPDSNGLQVLKNVTAKGIGVVTNFVKEKTQSGHYQYSEKINEILKRDSQPNIDLRNDPLGREAVKGIVEFVEKNGAEFGMDIDFSELQGKESFNRSEIKALFVLGAGIDAAKTAKISGSISNTIVNILADMNGDVMPTPAMIGSRVARGGAVLLRGASREARGGSKAKEIYKSVTAKDLRDPSIRPTRSEGMLPDYLRSEKIKGMNANSYNTQMETGYGKKPFRDYLPG
jgi:hypothetical protein